MRQKFRQNCSKILLAFTACFILFFGDVGCNSHKKAVISDKCNYDKVLLHGPLVNLEAKDWFLVRYDEYDIDNKRLVKEKAEIDFVFLGDSLTYRWNLDSHFADHSWRMVNRGVPGDTSWNMISRFEIDVVQLHPKSYHLWVGINDLFKFEEDIDRRWPEVVENVRKMVHVCQGNGMKPIIASVLPINKKVWDDVSGRSPLDNAIPKVNEELKKVAAQVGALYIDYYSAMVDESGYKLRSDLTKDGVHLNENGYRLLTDIFCEALKLKKSER